VTLQEIASDSKGQFFNAPNAARLEAVYRNLGTRLAVVHEKREITGAFAGGALLLLLAGGVVSLLRTGRLP
jgi:Ca-activated chloride channel family protein